MVGKGSRNYNIIDNIILIINFRISVGMALTIQIKLKQKIHYLCVLGPLKFQLMMMTVTRILTVFIMKVNSKYLAMSGSTSDVGGRIFDTSNKNTTSDSKMLIPNVT